MFEVLRGLGTAEEKGEKSEVEGEARVALTEPMQMHAALLAVAATVRSPSGLGGLRASELAQLLGSHPVRELDLSGSVLGDANAALLAEGLAAALGSGCRRVRVFSRAREREGCGVGVCTRV